MEAEAILDELDEHQRQAATALVGPTCILAGAGTGKTRTITHRIAYGIASGVFAANRILALTYTNKAAAEIRLRLRQLGAGNVAVKTFHAAALAQLEFFWPQFAGVAAPKVVESKLKLINEAASKFNIRLDAAAVRDIAAEIEWCKYSLTGVEGYLAARRGNIASIRPERVLELITSYEEIKLAQQVVDWEDVLLLTLGMLQAEPRALAHVQAQYRFFTVDEYQDISPLQQKLLDTWLGRHSELCVVGDPNQTIYSFTGATSKYLLNFSERYPEANLIRLSRNYRSSAALVRASNQLLTNPGSELESALPQGAQPRLVEFENDHSEAAAVAERIELLIEGSVKPENIAILYRTNSQSEVYEAALAERGIDYSVRGGERFFNRPEIIAATRAIRAEAAAPSGRSAFETVSSILRSLGWSSQPVTEKGAAREKWQALNSLLNLVEELGPEASIIEVADDITERMHSQHEPTKSALTLSTIHAAKGLEWDYLFVVGFAEGLMPISFAKTTEEIFEEQRLAYVAVSRAKRELQLSWAKYDASAKWQREVSRFAKTLRLN